MDRTLVIVKPDGVERRLIGEIIGRLERKGLRLVAAELRTIDEETAGRHYAEHAEKPFFPELVAFITRSPAFICVAEGPKDTWAAVRSLMGATNPADAAPGTIRGDLATELTENLIHGSDSAASASREIDVFSRRCTEAVVATVKVIVEAGRTKQFAIAADWPGWARAARTEDDALDALDTYRARYAEVLEAAGIAAPTGTLVVAETVLGDATTDFGAPGKVATLDHRAVRRADRDRFVSVLEACWRSLDETAAVTGELRTGPRGGGRSVAKMVDHVSMAEVAYARKLGLKVPSSADADDVAALRDRIVAVVAGTARPDRPSSWPLRYVVRRMAWHVVDHLFEMEDRAIS